MKKVIEKYVLIFLTVVVAICFLRIALVHDVYSVGIEVIILSVVTLIFVTYSLITTKIKKDKDKIKKL